MAMAPAPAPHPRPWSTVAEALVQRMRGGEPAGPRAALELVRALLDRPPSGAWHPTGFIVLQPHCDAAGALRVHLWPEPPREHGRPCWPVHDHVWHLRSEVLCGTVHSHAYELEDDDEGESVLYAVEYGEGRRSCMRRSSRRVRLREGEARHVEAGERYAVEAGAFHGSRVEVGELAATLVITTATDRPHPWVVGPHDGPEVVPVMRPRADELLVTSVLQQVEAALTRRSDA